jgi:hypothetical protein
MKKLFLSLTIITGVLLLTLVYEKMIVEATVGPAAIASIAVLGALFVAFVSSYVLYDTRYRELIRNVCLAAFSTVAAYAALDIIAGVILIVPLSPPLVPDEYRHHKMVPNTFTSFKQRDFQYIQRVNNLGLRGSDIPVVKPLNSERILMLGDSFTMGKGVEDDQTFSVVLEAALRKKVAECGGFRRIEVINGGVDSYAPILSYLQLTRDLAALEPDVVVLNLDVSDLVQETAYRQMATLSPDGAVLAVPQQARESSLTEKARTWIQRHLFLTRAILYYTIEKADYKEFGVRQVVEQANFAVAAHTLEGDSVPRDKQWQAIFDSVRRIKAYTDSRGIKFHLTRYPWAHQVSETEWIPGRYSFMPKGAKPSDKSLRTIRKFAAKEGIHFIELFNVFRQYRGNKPLYFKYDNHWTAAGHALVAQGLEAALVDQYIDDWCY